MEESKHTFKNVVIEEFFSKSDDGVINWHWKFSGDSEWNIQATPYKEMPYIKF